MDEECSNQATKKFDPLIKEQNIVIPQPDQDQINKIQNSCPKVKLFPQTSHELLSDISSCDIKNSAQRWDVLVFHPNYQRLCKNKILKNPWSRICNPMQYAITLQYFEIDTRSQKVHKFSTLFDSKGRNNFFK